MRTRGGMALRRWCVAATLMALAALLIVPVGTVRAAYVAQPTQPKIIPGDGMPGDSFGVNVAISADGSTAVVGASQKNSSAGAVYIYTRVGVGAWTLRQEITTISPLPGGIDQIAAGYQFGYAVAVSADGGVILIGAPHFSNGPGRGVAYILTTANHTTWTVQQEYKPTLAAGSQRDSFSFSVALTGDGMTALIGAPGSTSGNGAAYVFTNNGVVFGAAPTNVLNGGTSACFGQAVALSVTTGKGLVGASCDKTGTKGGAAYYYGGGFSTAPQMLQPTGISGSAAFGSAVALAADGTTALIGAPSENNAAPLGAAFAFSGNGTTFSNPTSPERFDPTDGNTTCNPYICNNPPPNTCFFCYFGTSVALSGDGGIAAIGETGGAVPASVAVNTQNPGTEHVYTKSGATFDAVNGKTLIASGYADGDTFGIWSSLSQDGATLLVGASFAHYTGPPYVPGPGMVYDFAARPDLAPAGPALPDGAVAAPYSQQFTATNGAGGPYTYATAPTGAPPAGVTDGPPPGLTINTNTGLFSGTPTTAGSYTFLVTATDKAGGATTQTYTLTIAPGATTTTVTNLTVPFSTAAQNVTLNAAVVSSPPGVTVNEGTVTFAIKQGATTIGTPPAPAAVANGVATASYLLPADLPGGMYTIAATYTPGADFTGSARTGTLNVGTATLTIAPPTLPNGTVGTPYSQQLTATGGSGTGYTFAVTTGTLPAGLTLTAAGLLSGTPTTAGAPTFTVTAKDSAGNTGTIQYILTINAGATTITISPPTLPNGAVGTPYSQQLTATGGSGTGYTFAVTTGTLPAGLTLTAAGLLAGTPTTPGAPTFTVTAKDSAGATGTRQYTLTITAAGPPPAAGLQYYALPTPVRLLDTRPGAIAFVHPNAPLTAGQSLTLPGQFSYLGVTIPATAQAIVGNATVDNAGGAPAAAGFATVHPDRSAPTTSNLNFLPGTVRANAFTATLAGDGTFTLFSSTGGNFVIDIVGYYAPVGAGGLYFHPLAAPVRELDTRSGNSAFVHPNATLTAGQTVNLAGRFSYAGQTIPASAQALVGNLTVADDKNGTGAGYATVYPHGVALPLASTVNYVAGTVAPNAFTVGVGGDGTYNLYASSGGDFVVDITGYFDTVAAGGLLYTPLSAPVRELDTRSGATALVHPNATLTAGQTLSLPGTFTFAGITVPVGAKALVGNATVANDGNGTPAGFATVYPDDVTLPLASNLNFVAKQVAPNAITVGIGAGGGYKLYSSTGGDFVVDITGYFS